jgi:hypothetical protein
MGELLDIGLVWCVASGATTRRLNRPSHLRWQNCGAPWRLRPRTKQPHSMRQQTKQLNHLCVIPYQMNEWYPWARWSVRWSVNDHLAREPSSSPNCWRWCPTTWDVRLSATVTSKFFLLYHFFPLFSPLFFHLPQRFPLNTPPILHYHYKR